MWIYLILASSFTHKIQFDLVYLSMNLGNTAHSHNNNKCTHALPIFRQRRDVQRDT